MRLALLLVPLLLAGCLSTPVKRNFPEIPADLKTACPALKEIDPTTTKLSTVVEVVSSNYGDYQECKIKVDSWIEWYNTQKTIFESVK
jgi:hypothetical protein